MKLPPVRIKELKDWNADAMPSELELGVCSSVTNVVFRDGFAERVEGPATIFTGSVQPGWLQYFASPLGGLGYFVAYSNHLKVYAQSGGGGANTEITRRTEGVAIASSTAAGTTVTVNTTTAHGRTTGDVISRWGAVPAEYNVEGKSITVTDSDTFTYVADSAPSGNATVQGLYSYDGATQDFTTVSTSTGGRATGGVLNGILLFNHPIDGLYYWNGDTSTRLRKVPGSYVSRVARVFKNFIFQLAPTMSGTEYPYRVLWSGVAEPGSLPSSFDSSTTSLAGFVDLADANAEMMDCLPLADTNIIYTENGRYSAQFVPNSQEVFRFTKLRGVDGLMSRHCVVDTPLGHVFLTKTFDVMLFDGTATRSLNEGRVKSLTAVGGSALLDTNNFLAVNPIRRQVYVCLVTGTVSLKADRVLIWSWEGNKWGQKTPASTTFTAATTGLGEFANGEALLIGESATDKVGVQSGAGSDHQDFGVSFDSTIELSGIHLDNPDVFKTLHRSRPKFDAANGQTFSVSHGSSKTPDGPITYGSAVTFTQNTNDYVDSRATAGRYLAWKVTWTRASFGNLGRVRSIDLDITAGGAR